MFTRVFQALLHIILEVFRGVCKTITSFVMSVCPHGTSSAPIARILKKFYICDFFENLSRNLKFH
jgi:hypothetical protein